MKKQKGSIKNTLKNTALVVLTVLMFVLTVAAWDIGVWQGEEKSFLGRLRAIGSFSDSPRADHSAAAEPAYIAVRTQAGLIGAAYQEAGISELYSAVSGILADAMKRADIFEEAEEAEFVQALRQQDTILCIYSGEIPFTLVAGWAGAERKGQSDLRAGTIVLSKEGTLYIREPAGNLYKAAVSINAQLWETEFDTVATGLCAYAAEEGYETLFPETLIMQDKLSFDILETNTLDLMDAARGEAVGEILEAFGYNPYMMNSYVENAGETNVFVENYSELRISRSGAVSYRAISTTGGITAYNTSENDKSAQLAAQVDFSHTLLGALIHATGGSTKASLQSVHHQEHEGQTGNCVLTFSQTYGGVLIETQDTAFARFEFKDEQLISAQIHLVDYIPTGERLYILPVQQAAATRQDGGVYRFAVRYLDSGDGRMLAQSILQ